MRNEMVLTLTGPDRVGIVEEVTRVLLGLDANVTTSRMARLGGEFAIILLASVPEGADLGGAFGDLESQGYSVAIHSSSGGGVGHADWVPYRIEVCGADHEGIVHEIAAGLSAAGISIESMETGTTSAPVTGATLFTMQAQVVVPPSLAANPAWSETVREAGNRSNVDVIVLPGRE
ncbi:MAG TPA: ACT domain-containing protein [Coriobacteriia bacterium]|nr:ACT domain-containing protein [Coriobacteriia bacterium]